ncbi:MAG TPA: hypothetical protein VIE88_14835 [Vicinamibacteria bacterium]
MVIFLEAMPRWIRWVHQANEAQAIADLRTVISAEWSYASANCSFFAPLTELTRADDGEIGIPGYPGDEPEFLDGALGRDVPYSKDGYVRDWIGAPYVRDLTDGWVNERWDTTRCDDESVLDYCYGAVPASSLRGVRSFSAHGSGAITVDADGKDQCPLNEYEN